MRILRSAFVAVLATLLAGVVSAQEPRPTAPPTGAPRPGISPLPPRDAQTTAPGTAVIRGRVVRADNGQPLRRVVIRGSAPGVREPLTATTDDNGRYELTALPAGRYTFTATKGGFITLQFGQRRPFEPGRPIELGEGQKLEQVDFALPRGAAITGRIVDDAGEPVTGAVVQVLRPRYVKGQRQLQAAGATQGQTNDLGEFRVFGVPPGDYYLSATVGADGPGPSALSGFVGVGAAATLYPGTTNPVEAQLITVGLGQEVSGMSFALLPVRMATISGAVRGADGRIPTGVSVSLGQSMAYSSGMSSRGSQLRADGTFSFPNLPPGEYSISARSQAQGTESAGAKVQLEGSNVTLSLTMRPGDAARGRVRFDTGSSQAAIRPSEVRVLAASATDPIIGFGVGSQAVKDDWTFEVTGLAGSRLLRATVPVGWAVKSIRAGVTDITDTPLDFNGTDVEGIEVLLTQRITEVSGTVTDSRGQRVTDATVVMFADDRQKWGPETRFRSTGRPDQDGRFRLRGLPPGRYIAVALDYLEPGEETNPELLERLRGAGTSVTLGEGESKALELKLTEAP